MRYLCSTAALLLAGLAFAQDQPNPYAAAAPPPVKPDVVIYIREDAMGADAVDVSMLNEKYPAELLQKRIDTLCTSLNYPPRALTLYHYKLPAKSPNLDFLGAKFTTENLTRPDRWANLTPLVRAFAGAPAPYTIHGMEVFFDEFNPPLKGPKDFSSAALTVTGRVDAEPAEVEYAIALLTQNPSEISVETKPQPVEGPRKEQPVDNHSSLLLWCLILIAALAAGALVYFLVIKRLSDSSATSVSHKP